MENSLGEDLSVGTYRSDDNARNIKVKVKLRKVANVCLQGKSVLSFQDAAELELMDLIKTSTTEIEEVFSLKGSLKDERSKSQKTYKSPVHEIDADNVVLKALTDADIFDSKWKSERAGTYPMSNTLHLENLMLSKKGRRIGRFPKQETWQTPLFSDGELIVKRQISSKRTSLFPPSQTIVILAQLNYKDSPSEEIELSYVNVDSHGILTVIPDFCPDKPFTFQSSRSETFEYTIELMSRSISKIEVERQNAIIKKVMFHHRKILDSSVGSDFVMPPSNTFSCHIHGEIVSASNFEAEDIFIHYKFELQDGWTSNSEMLEGTTQTCRSKEHQRVKKNLAYFGYVFSQELEINSEKLTDERMQRFCIIVEVTSLDKWGNFRNEGYGYCEIPIKPGIHTSNVNTWKLIPTTLTNALRHFFIGGTPYLEDLSYARIPTEVKASELSKYGLQSETSGVVTIKSWIITQSS